MSNSDKGFLGHPIGLAILFFTEMWERFSYYGMRALLVLYISSTVEKGGLGWTNASALDLYGIYTALVYIMSIPGGIIADKLLGQKKTVMLGGLLLCLGHGILALEGLWAFYTGLALIIFGVGGLKPNISTMVGGLYQKGDIRRDKGFTIFYIGINVGAFLSSIIVGYVGETIGWHYGFGLAGIGMVLGQIVFIAGQKYLKGVGDLLKKEEPKNNSKEKVNYIDRFLKNPISLIATISLIIGGTLLISLVGGIVGIKYGLVLIFLAPFAGFGINVYKYELSKIERDRVFVLLTSFIIIIVFFGAFEQAGGLMNIYANEKIDRLGIPASVFQSVNAFFILIFGALVANFWVFRKKRGKESSSVFKMATGTIVLGLGFVMMSMASVEASSKAFGNAALYWLILAYLLHTLGELSASPVSLSFITKLAPAQYVSIMMGAYFAATGMGNMIAGDVGKASQSKPIEIAFKGDKNSLKIYKDNFKNIKEDKGISFKAQIYLKDNQIEIVDLKKQKTIRNFFKLDDKNEKRLITTLKEEKTTINNKYHAKLSLEKEAKVKEDKNNKVGDAKSYSGTMRIEEIQSRLEFWTFTGITIVTILFGLLLILFLKKLKALTHGVEEAEKSLD